MHPQQTCASAMATVGFMSDELEEQQSSNDGSILSEREWDNERDKRDHRVVSWERHSQTQY